MLCDITFHVMLCYITGFIRCYITYTMLCYITYVMLDNMCHHSMKMEIYAELKFA